MWHARENAFPGKLIHWISSLSQWRISLGHWIKISKIAKTT